MRRTRERLFTAESSSRGMASGLLIFEGEDLEYVARTRMIQKTMKDRFDEQIREKQSTLQSRRESEMNSHAEYMRMNSLFGQREDQYRVNYRRRLEDIKAANLLLAQQKKDRLLREKKEQIEAENRLFSELTRRRTSRKAL